MEEYEQQPLEAIAAVAKRELDTLAKAMERSKNLKGTIVRDLWGVFSKLSAALMATMNRAGEGSDGGSTAEDGASLSGERSWAEERRRLRADAKLLRLDNARLRRMVERVNRSPRSPIPPTPELTPAGGRPAAGARINSDGAQEEPPTPGATSGDEEARVPVVLTEEDLRAPVFRPPLQGVRK
ncbi:hypothetical protein ALC60_11849 [Trachymyrmex zeteki]|uniref:Uncharacterized protein n=1 Tax=Mycetomoellerius zeteki TaxID=64791 RepID=A0A151WMJ7_9HYME|nr:hypothetical protein ALC60_11849 [Trachymyrmex zeteki]